MFTFNNQYDNDYYDRPDPVYTRGCRCNSLSESPCSYCEGDYRCPGGCGNSSYDCSCPLEWDELDDDEQRRRINEAFDYLYSRGEVPYGVATGDDGTRDEYDPAIELAQEWYDNERIG